MPSTDDRIVSMKFDNRSFEQKIAGTIDSLDKLKKSLDFANAGKGLSEITNAGRAVNLDGIGNAIEEVKNKFSVMNAVAFSVIGQITSRAFAAGESLAKSLSLDQIISGYQEYETNINSIQTILANTQSKGSTLQDVNAALDDLNTYSDQTIYNFSQMTRNIGTFTSAGVDLKTSTSAIKGIANIAAISGSNAEQASTAMYQLSQALASGSVKLMDWNSVVNAGMGGEIFQKALFETGKSLNKIKGVKLDTTFEDWKKAGNTFRGSLEQGWLTADVLTNTLQGFTGDLSAAQLTALGYTEAQAQEMMKLGKLGKDAATKVKTLSQLLSTVKEAVGSGWSATFRTIFGDFEQSKQLFSAWNAGIGLLVSANADARNNILADWERLGGRTAIIESINQIFKNLLLVFKPIKDAFREIFPRKTGADLAILSKNLYNFLKQLEPSTKTIETVKRIFKGLFAAVEIGFTIFKAVFKVFKGLMSVFAGVGGSPIIGFIAGIADGIVALNKTLVDGGGIDSFVQKILLSFGKLQGILTTFISWFKIGLNGASSAAASSGNAIVKIAFKIGSAFNKIKDFDFSKLLLPLQALWSGLKVAGKALGVALVAVGAGIVFVAKAIGQFGSGVIDKVSGFFTKTGTSVQTFSSQLKALKAGGGLAKFSESLRGVSGSVDSLKSSFSSGVDPAKKMKEIGTSAETGAKGTSLFQSFLSGIGSAVKSVGKKIGQLFSKISFTDILLAITTGGFVSIANSIRKFVDGLADVMKNAAKVVGNVANMFKEFTGVLESLQTSIKAGALIKIAAAIAILAGSLILLSFVDPVSLAFSLGALAGSMKILMMAMNDLAEMTKKGINTKTLVAFSITLGIVAFSLMIMAKAVSMFGKMSPGELAKGLGAIAIVMNILNKGLKKFTETFQAMGDLKVIKMISALLGIAGALNSLAKVIERFGNMDPKKLMQGLAGASAALTMLVVAVNKLPDGLAKKTKGMLGFSAALYVIAKTIELLGTMKPDVLLQGMVAFIGILAALMIALAVMPESELAGLGMALLGLSVGMLAIALALKVIGSIDFGQLAKGIGALTIVLGLLVISMLMLDGATPGAVALGIAAVSLLLLANAMQQFASIKLSDIGKGLLAIAGVLLVIGAAAIGASIIIGPLIALGAALLLIGAGFALFGLGAKMMADAFVTISNAGETGIAVFERFLSSIINAIPDFLKGVGDGLVGLADTLVTLAPKLVEGLVKIVIQLLKGLRKVLPELGTTIGEIIDMLLQLLVDKGPDIINAGFTFLLNFLSGLQNNISKIVDVVVGIVSAFLLELANRAVEIVDGGLKVLTAFLLGISENIGQVISAGTSIITNLITGIGNAAIDIANAAINVLISFATAIGNNLVKATDAGTDILGAILDAMINATTTIGTKIGELITKFADEIIANVSTAGDKGVDIVLAIMDTMAGATIQIADGMFRFMTSILTGLADVINKRSSELRDAGLDLAWAVVDGMTFGLAGGIADIGGGILDLGGSIISGFSSLLGINSPSKVFMKLAGSIPEGIVKGLNKDRSAVASVQNLAGRIGDGFNASLSKLPSYDMIGEINPTITPVLDLTNVQRDAASVGAMFGTNSISAKLSTDQANALAAAKVGQPAQTDTPTQVMKEVKFEQNIYSPTTLSTSQIYRQTRSQITLAKERLGLQ